MRPTPGLKAGTATADPAVPEGRSARNQPAPLLSAENVELVYKTKRDHIHALSNLSLDVRDGEFVSILGPSGCGKSSFLKLAAGLLIPSAGRVYLNGSQVVKPNPDVGVVFQKASLMPWKTVLQNVLVAAQSLNLDAHVAKNAALDYLRLVGLEKFTDSYPGELSGGMQQRVGLVRGLVHNPKVLLMDEPFAALDAMTREQLTLELQKLWMTTDKSVVFITHSIPEAVFLSDRILVMSARPGTIAKTVDIPMPRPRGLDTMATSEFAEICNDLRAHFSSFMAGD